MKSVKRNLLTGLSVAGVLALGLTACSGGGGGGGGDESLSDNEVPDVGVINEYTLPDIPDTGETYRAAAFVAQQEQGDAISFTDALKTFGAEHGLEVDIYDAGGYAQIDKQINQIQTALATDPDVLLVWATDPNAVVPVLEEAGKRDIPVINWVLNTAYEGAATTINTDWVSESKKLTTAIGEYLGGEGQLITAYGGCGGEYQRDLQAGSEEAAAEMPGLEIAVAECPPDFDPSKVQTIVENGIAANPEINGVLTSVMSQSVGAVNAVRAAGAQDQIVVGSGIITSCEDVDLIKTGQVPIVSGLPAAHIGELGATIALRILAGEDVEELYSVPNNIYTAQNIDDVDLSYDLTPQFLEGC